MTGSDAVEGWLAWLELAGHRPETIVSRMRAVASFVKHLGDRSILEAAATDVAAWLTQPHLKPATRATYYACLKSFYKWALKRRLVAGGESPLEDIPSPAAPIGTPRPIAELDLKRALQFSEDPVTAWFELAAFGGLRACEIAQLRSHDLDPDAGVVWIRESKGGQTSVVPAHDRIVDVFGRVVRSGADDWLFPSSIPGRHISAHSVSVRANRALRQLDIVDTFHSLRHYYGTTVLRRSAGQIRIAQVALRHKSLASTQRYTQVTDAEVAAVVRSI